MEKPKQNLTKIETATIKCSVAFYRLLTYEKFQSVLSFELLPMSAFQNLLFVHARIFDTDNRG